MTTTTSPTTSELISTCHVLDEGFAEDMALAHQDRAMLARMGVTAEVIAAAEARLASGAWDYPAGVTGRRS